MSVTDHIALDVNDVVSPELLDAVSKYLREHKPHWRTETWPDREWTQRYITIALYDPQPPRRRFNDKQKAALINTTRSQWRQYHEYWYKLTRDYVKLHRLYERS